MKVSQRFSEIQTGTVGSMLEWSHFTKRHNYIKTVGGVMELILCTSTDYAVCLYQDISKGFRVIEWTWFAC